MFSVVSNTALINGSKGIYDGKISNESVKYGRNAVANHYEYLFQLQEDLFSPNIGDDDFEFTPINFEMRYQPETTKKGSVDLMALMGSAYEEMGKKISLSVKSLSELLQKAFGDGVSAEALDVNKDEQVDLAEYAGSILLFDMLSTNSENLDVSNINGVITNQGEIAALPYVSVQNLNVATEVFEFIYQHYDLQSAQKEFLANDNNLA